MDINKALVLEKLMEENAKLKDDYLRAFAEAENTKKLQQSKTTKIKTNSPCPKNGHGHFYNPLKY